MKFITLFIALILNMSALPAVASQDNNRIFLALSLQPFNPVGQRSCDNLLVLDQNFPMGVIDVEGIKTCRNQIKIIVRDLRVYKENGEVDKEVAKKVANLLAWDSLLIYWIYRIDSQDSEGNIFFAVQSASQALNHLKLAEANIATFALFQTLGAALYSKSQIFGEIAKFNEAYEYLLKIYSKLGEGIKGLTEHERTSLHAYSAYWLGIITLDKALFVDLEGGNAQAQHSELNRAAYNFLREASAIEPNNKARLGYVLALSEHVQKSYNFGLLAPVEIDTALVTDTPQYLAKQIERAAESAKNKQVQVWNLINQARTVSYKIKSVNSDVDKQAESLLDQAESISKTHGFRHYLVDIAVIRSEKALRFFDLDVLNEQGEILSEIISYLNKLSGENPSEMALWAGRYFSIVNVTGQVLLSNERHDDAKKFFSLLASQHVVSGALNLSALQIKDADYQTAIKTLISIRSEMTTSEKVVYSHNLSLAKHLSGDIQGAIDTLMEDNSPSDHSIAYQAALYALSHQHSLSVDLVKDHAGTGYGALSQSLIRTALSVYQVKTTNPKSGSILNTPQPLFSFAEVLVFNDDVEKVGFPYFYGQGEGLLKERATLVTGLRGGSLRFSTELSVKGAIVATSTENKITLWNANTGLPFRHLTNSSDVQHMDFLHEDKHLLVQSSDNLLTLWDLTTGEPIYTLPVNINIRKAYWLNRSNNTLFYLNSFGDFIAMDSHNPKISITIPAVKGGSIVALDEQGSRLFFSRSIYDGKGGFDDFLVSYDLEKNRVLHEISIKGKIRELSFVPYNQHLIVIRDMAPSNFDIKRKPDYQLGVWDLGDDFKETKSFSFDTTVSVLKNKGKELLLNDSDNRLLDLDSIQLKKMPDSRGLQILRLSANNTRAILHDISSGDIHVADYPSLRGTTRLKWQESDPSIAFYDEDSERLLVSSGYNRLHVWDMSTGQELHRRDQSPALKPTYINGNLIAVVDGVDDYLPENNQWGYFDEGQLNIKDLPVPEDVVNSNFHNDLQSFESGQHIYFTSGDKYGSQDRRVWRSDIGLATSELLPWTLEKEHIAAISEQKELLITEDGKRIVIRSLKDASKLKEIAITAESGGAESIKVSWVDLLNETIWVEHSNRLIGYDFNGAAKHRFVDELGSLIQIAGSEKSPYFFAGYEVSGSTLLRKINRKTGKVIQSDVLFNQVAKGMNLSSKSTYLLLSTTAGSIEFWSIRENKTLFSMYLLEGDTWVAIDSQGRFDTNNIDDMGFLAWRLPQEPLKSYPVDIFLRNFYEPRLIPRLLNDAPFSPIPDLSLINRWQPQVDIPTVISSENGKLSVEVKLAKGNWPLGDQAKAYDLRLFRNGQQVAVYPKDHGEVVFNNEGQRTVVFKDISLPNLVQGQQVVFTAMAFNGDGVKSETANYTYTQENPRDVNPPHAFVINVGIDHYSDSIWDLAFAGNDAKLLGDTLVNDLQRSNVFQSVQRQEIITQQGQLVDRNQLRKVFENLSIGSESGNKSTPDDTVIITWSGHGYVDEQGEFYLLTSEVGQGRENMDTVLEGAISATELSRWIEGVDVDRFILIIDACHSAAAVDGKEFKPGPMGNKGFGQLAWYKGMQILTASQANDVALESSLLEHGLLTYSLVSDGLVAELADFLPADGKLTASEWLKYGQKRVPEIYRILKSGNASALKTSRGVKRKNIPKVEKVQLPGLFDFYRGNNEVELRGH